MDKIKSFWIRPDLYEGLSGTTSETTSWPYFSKLTWSILNPNHPLLTSPNWIRSLITLRATEDGIARPIPSEPPEEDLIMVLMPINLPFISINAPPELPLFMDASVYK